VLGDADIIRKSLLDRRRSRRLIEVQGDSGRNQAG